MRILHGVYLEDEVMKSKNKLKALLKENNELKIELNVLVILLCGFSIYNQLQKVEPDKWNIIICAGATVILTVDLLILVWRMIKTKRGSKK